MHSGGLGARRGLGRLDVSPGDLRALEAGAHVVREGKLIQLPRRCAVLEFNRREAVAGRSKS